MTTDQQLEPSAPADSRPIPPEVLAARDAVTIAEAVVALTQRDFLEWWGPINPPDHDDGDEAGEFAISEEEFRQTFEDVFKHPRDESP